MKKLTGLLLALILASALPASAQHVRLNGHNMFNWPVYFPLGSATLPAVTTPTDTDTGIYFGGSNNILFGTNATLAGDVNASRWNFALPVYLPNGTLTAPALVFASETGTGMRWISAGFIGFETSSTDRVGIWGNGIRLAATGGIGWSSAGVTDSADLNIGRESAAVLQMGDDAAGVTDQMFKAPDRITSDGVGGKLTFAGGRNRGASAGGPVCVQTSPAAGAGVVGTLADRFCIDSVGAFSPASGHITFSPTAPTISSGFGTDPSIVANNGTAAFTVNVGTGGIATGGVVGLPTATTGWACSAADITTPASFVTVQTATAATTATFANYARTTGLLLAWTASDVLSIQCTGY